MSRQVRVAKVLGALAGLPPGTKMCSEENLLDNLKLQGVMKVVNENEPDMVTLTEAGSKLSGLYFAMHTSEVLKALVERGLMSYPNVQQRR